MDPCPRAHDAVTRLARSAGGPAIGSQASPAPGRLAPADAVGWGALFGGPALDAVESQALADLASPRQAALGESVLSRSQPARTLVALQRGEVALGLHTAGGRLRIERIVRGPVWLDLGSAWLGLPHAMDAHALGPAWLVEWPCDGLAQRLPQHPGLALRLLRSLAWEVHAQAVNIQELMHKDAPGRLASWLYQHSEPLPGQVGQAVVRLQDRKRDLASQLAITPETLSRLMRSFSRRGVIAEAGYTVRVIDPAALARLAHG